ncbi:unnamed protein product [Diamesa serratosioi]
MLEEKIEQLVAMLEKQELEDSIQDPKLYHELFAGYLYLNDLNNARFLWKRIPAAVKAGNPEIEQMWKIHSCLWKNEIPEFYNLIKFEWSVGVREVMFELKEKVQLETIHLVGRAYSSIFENVFAEMTNQTPEQIVDTCKNFNWEVQDGAFPRLIIPKKPVIEKISCLDAQDQLSKLTDYVSFLEN